MLVLQRKPEQRIKIGDDITITICRVRGEKVAVGVEAPDAVPIHREEVYEAIQKQKANESAA